MDMIMIVGARWTVLMMLMSVLLRATFLASMSMCVFLRLTLFVATLCSRFIPHHFYKVIF
jgi:hypothetical protein